MTQPNKEIPSYLRLHEILRVLLKLLFISVALTIASLICTLSYPCLDRSLKDAAALLPGKPEKPPPKDVYLKRKETERSKDKELSPDRLASEVDRAFQMLQARRQARRDRSNYDGLMAQYRNDIFYWNRAENRWQSSLVLGFFGLSGVLFSLVLIGFAILAVRSEKFPSLRAPP